MRKYSKRTTVIAVTTAILLGTAGGAYAYWTTAGSGTGTAGAATAATAVTVTQTAVTGLFPGGSQALSGTIGNPQHNLVVTTLATVVSVDAAHATAGCKAADFVISGTANIVKVTDALGTYSDTWSGLTLTFNNTVADQNTCKGATVSVAYTAS